MSIATRNNPYRFDEFIEWRKNVDYYEDDPFIQKVVKTYTGEEWERMDAAARAISKKNVIPVAGSGECRFRSGKKAVSDPV